MSYMNQAEFAPAAGIQELSFEEIMFVSGGAPDPGVRERAKGLQTLGTNIAIAGRVVALAGIWFPPAAIAGTVISGGGAVIAGSGLLAEALIKKK